MRQAIAGDSGAFSVLYEEYFSPVYRYVYFRVQNKSVAEDITQTVFLKIFEKLPEYQDRQRPPLAYFFTVARNKVIDYWRKNKRIESMDDDNDLSKVADTIESAENIFSRTIATAQLSSALENIPKDQREVIILKFINEFSYEEIASLFKKKEPAIRKIASRGLENLKKYFAKKNINIYE